MFINRKEYERMIEEHNKIISELKSEKFILECELQSQIDINKYLKIGNKSLQCKIDCYERAEKSIKQEKEKEKEQKPILNYKKPNDRPKKRSVS